LALEFVNKKQ